MSRRARTSSPVPSSQQATKRKPASPEPLKASDADYQRILVLGRGAYAKVVLVEERRTGIRYAMKILNKNHIVAQRQAEHTMTERHILSCTSAHPFIVNLRAAYRTATTLNLVMDYCPGGELFFHLTREGVFDEKRAKFIVAELTLALGHLHASGIVYRDLKPENILIDADGHMRLADFGLSKEGILNVASGAHTFCGTPEYLAPEILQRTGHGTAVDWWSLGALLYEMLTGLPPWYSQNRKEMYQGIMHGALTFPPQVSPLAREIITLLLERDPMRRLGSRGGVMEVRRHPFFADVDFEALLEKRCPAPWVPPKDADGACFDTLYTQQPVHSLIASQPGELAHDFAGFSWAPPEKSFPASSPPNTEMGASLATPTFFSNQTTSAPQLQSEGLVPVRDPVVFDDDDEQQTHAASANGAGRSRARSGSSEEMAYDDDAGDGNVTGGGEFMFQMEIEQ